MVSTLYLHCTHIVPTLHLHCTCNVPILYLHCSYIVPELHLHCTYIVPTLYLNCTRIVPILYLYYICDNYLNKTRSKYSLHYTRHCIRTKDINARCSRYVRSVVRVLGVIHRSGYVSKFQRSNAHTVINND